MDRRGADVGPRRRAFAVRPPPEEDRLPVVPAAFVAAYVVLQGVVTLSAGAAGVVYAASLLLLVALSGGVFFASLREPRPAAARCYLALSLLPILTVARLAFSDTPIALLDPLLVYLLLAVTLLALRQTTGLRSEIPALGGRALARAAVLGVALAAGITMLDLVLPLPGGAVNDAPWLLALVLAPVALVDELWFRGILQGSIANLTSAPSGWIATAVLFAAYGEPFGPPAALLFRIGLGLVLGALAIRRQNLPVTLVARTLMTVGLVALNPGLAATSFLV